MTEPATPQGPSLALFDILQLIAGARKSAAVERHRQDEVSSLIKIVSAAWHQADLSAQSFGPNETKGSASRLAPAHLWEGLPVPDELAWNSIGKGPAVIFPPVMRSGLHHENQDLPSIDDFMLHTLAWRYLATRLAMGRDLHSRLTPDYLCDLIEVQHSLARAARAHRVLGGMLLRKEEVVGGMTALAVTPQKNDDSLASYLITVSALSDAGKNAPELATLAKKATSKVRNTDGNHDILIADGTDRAAALDPESQTLDRQIHLFDSPGGLRFLVFVSDLPDDHRKELAARDIHESRFRLSKSRLRDVFLGRDPDYPRFHREAEVRWQGNAKKTPGKPADVGFLGLHSVVVQLKTKSQHKEGGGNENLISRGQVARNFFGYKGLPEPDLQ